MPEKPSVKPGDWIFIGKPSHFGYGGSVLVCQVYTEGSMADCEVVYLDKSNRAINEDLVWDGEYWQFKYQAGGGYADKYERLRDFVAQLRSGGGKTVTQK